MTIREACIKVHNQFIADPGYVCYGTDADETEIRLYARDYYPPLTDVPAMVGEWPVRVLSIASVRHGYLERPA